MALLRKVTLLVTLFGSIVTLGFLLPLFSPRHSDVWAVAAFALLWTLLPFGVLAAATRLRSLGNASLSLLLAAALLFSAFSFLAYNEDVLRSSSTAGLVFIFIPLWELVGLGLILGVLLLAAKFRGKKPSNPP